MLSFPCCDVDMTPAVSHGNWVLVLAAPFCELQDALQVKAEC